ncbi:MAG: AAA family ATPase [Deltaproteobacteria bacterium]|nr:AAA family ATPase [Deltaproteobacteria bacterium]
MRITDIAVKGLFGTFDHHIPLNLNERVTIIHGPNGFGKTVLLQLIDGLFNYNYEIFSRVPFSLFRIKFTNETSLNVKKSRPTSAGGGPEIKAYGLRPEDELIDLASLSLEGITDFAGDLENLYLELRRTGLPGWFNTKTGSTPDGPDKTGLYVWWLLRRHPRYPDWLAIIRSVNPVCLISSDRLMTSQQPVMDPRSGAGQGPMGSPGLSGSSTPPPNKYPAVTEYSRQLSAKIQKTLADSTQLSLTLDNTYPKRLIGDLREKKWAELSEGDIRRELSELEKKMARLAAAGLLDKQQDSVEIPNQPVGRDTSHVLMTYVSDVKQKLGIFDEMLQRIELLKRIINEYFYGKELIIDRQEGVVFTGPDGNRLPLAGLSSGEQHLLVLVYKLLFEVETDSLVMIDELETSLHIAWQQKFLDDLMEITGLVGFDCLIATHSPDIISDHWELTVALEARRDQAEARPA